MWSYKIKKRRGADIHPFGYGLHLALNDIYVRKNLGRITSCHPYLEHLRPWEEQDSPPWHHR